MPVFVTFYKIQSENRIHLQQLLIFVKILNFFIIKAQMCLKRLVQRRPFCLGGGEGKDQLHIFQLFLMCIYIKSYIGIQNLSFLFVFKLWLVIQWLVAHCRRYSIDFLRSLWPSVLTSYITWTITLHTIISAQSTFICSWSRACPENLLCSFVTCSSGLFYAF